MNCILIYREKVMYRVIQIQLPRFGSFMNSSYLAVSRWLKTWKHLNICVFNIFSWLPVNQLFDIGVEGQTNELFSTVSFYRYRFPDDESHNRGSKIRKLKSLLGFAPPHQCQTTSHRLNIFFAYREVSQRHTSASFTLLLAFFFRFFFGKRLR